MYELSKETREAIVYDHVRIKTDYGYSVCYVCSDEWPCLVIQVYRALVQAETKKERAMTKP